MRTDQGGVGFIFLQSNTKQIIYDPIALELNAFHGTIYTFRIIVLTAS